MNPATLEQASTQPQAASERFVNAPPTSESVNPLLEDALHCRYPALHAEHVVPAIRTLLQAAQHCLDAVVALETTPCWETLVAPLDQSLGKLSRAWALVGHLNAVRDTPAWREAYNRLLPDVTRFYTGLEQNAGLYAQLRALQATNIGTHLSPAHPPEYPLPAMPLPASPSAPASEANPFPGLGEQRARALTLALRDFRLSGVELNAEQKAELAALLESLSSLGQKFSENILDAMDAAQLLITEASQLRGLPPDVIEAARRDAEDRKLEGWRFTPHMPSYLPVVQYAEDREFRHRMLRLHSTLASDQGDARFNNAAIMEQILEKRLACARLLGFEHFSDYALESKMAESGEQVLKFLADLVAKARPQARLEIETLRRFAANHLGIPVLEAWDLAFSSQKLKKERFSFSDQDLKPYFPIDQVLCGLFELIETLFGYRLVPLATPAWHPEVRSYALHRLRNDGLDPESEAWAFVHLDLFARPGKRNGAWMSSAADRRREEGQLKPAVTWLNCNFQPPVGDRPALLTHDDVTTLLHEFGHGLHHMLTTMEEPRICGLNGVEWDAVELPSQFLENFAWEWETLSRMSRHVETGAPLSRELFERMTASRNFMIGMHLVRQLEFGLFDLQLHRRAEALEHAQIHTLLGEIRSAVAVAPYPDFNRFANSFSHIFSGGYASGYYSYLWAEVLSADCYAAFTEEKEGALYARSAPERQSLGRSFLRNILSVGSARPTLESFRAFLGRDPSIDALLRLFGLASEGSSQGSPLPAQ
jgi:oligopeptidase A